MNAEDRKEVGRCWLNLAKMYGRDLPQVTLSVMLDAVDDLDRHAVMEVMRAWASHSKFQRPPLPVEIREKIIPVIDNKDLARETALRIHQAVGKFGYTNPASAKEFIGEAGWVAVNRFGGWTYLCGNLGSNLDVTTFIAQCRDVLESQLKMEDAGFDLDKPMIEQCHDKNVLSLVKSATNLIKGESDDE